MLYSKAVAMVIATIVSAIVAALAGDEVISATEWVNIVVIGLGAISVGIVPNLNTGIAEYAKGVIAFVTAASILAMTLMDGGLTTSEWLQIAIAGGAAIGVVALPAPKHKFAPQPGAGPVVQGPA